MHHFGSIARSSVIAGLSSFLALASLFCAATTLSAQDKKPAAKKAAPQAETSAELATIRDGAEKFVAAFNKKDAKAVAALWTENGEFVTADGQTLVGRAAIEKEYADFFANQPQQKLRLVIDSLKLLSDSAALEDGRIVLDPLPPGPPALSKYMAVHVKVDGRWLMSSVRDTRVETPSNYRNLEDLEWMIGKWTAEEHGAKTEVNCRWVANKSFVERTYSVTAADGHVQSSGVQMIGWNAIEGRLQSWNFASDGGHSIGAWAPRAGGWQITSQGSLPSGAPMSAVTLLTRLDDSAMVWQSISRTAAGMAMPDTDEIILKRAKSDR